MMTDTRSSSGTARDLADFLAHHNEYHSNSICANDPIIKDHIAKLVKWEKFVRSIHGVAQRPPVQEALDLAVNIIMANEPGDSRAVSDEAVALAAVACGDTSDGVMKVIREALSLPSTDHSPPARMLPCPVCGGEAIHAIEVLQRTTIAPVTSTDRP